MARTFELATAEHDVAQLLQSYIQSGRISFLIGSGASRPAIETAGDIEKQINKLLMEGKEAEANLLALDFIEDLNEKNDALLKGGGNADVKATVEAYAAFIAIVDRILFERKNVLLPRQANVFTTNYDSFIEHASQRIPTLILNDGFSRAPGTDAEYPFEPERYSDRTYRSGAIYSHPSEVPAVNLVKLHGSLCWKSSGTSVVYDPMMHAALSEDEKKNETKVVEELQKYFLVFPNLKKFHATLMDRVYYGLLRIFANALDQENALLISFGFSFEDEHILDITRRALRNPTATLLIFVHDPTTVGAFEQKFAMNRNAIIVSPGVGQLTDFHRLTGLLENVVPA